MARCLSSVPHIVVKGPQVREKFLISRRRGDGLVDVVADQILPGRLFRPDSFLPHLLISPLSVILSLPLLVVAERGEAVLFADPVRDRLDPFLPVAFRRVELSSIDPRHRIEYDVRVKMLPVDVDRIEIEKVIVPEKFPAEIFRDFHRGLRSDVFRRREGKDVMEGLGPVRLSPDFFVFHHLMKCGLR